MTIKIPIDSEQITKFCKKWMIVELSFFGSVIRDDFSPESDIDILVSFSPDADWSLLDLVAMQYELEEIFERDVDIVKRKTIERSHNWIRRKAILENLEPFYVAG